ncbi:MAG: T9SS type A sorting domain-containing protein [bacterium]
MSHNSIFRITSLKLLLLTGILITSNAIACAPDTLWTRTFGGTNYDFGKSIQETFDSGFIVVGSTVSFATRGGYDFYLIRTNSSGDTLWTRTFGEEGNDWGNSVQETSDSGFVIAGTICPNSTDIYFVKTNSSGDSIWAKIFGHAGNYFDYGYSVQKTSDNGFIISGEEGNSNIYLIRTNSSGTAVWLKTFGENNSDFGNSVQETSDGGFIITGGTTSSGTSKGDVYLTKVTSSGDVVWTKTFGGTKNDGGCSVRQTKDGGFIITGSTSSFGAGGSDVYLIKTDSSGNTLWTRTFGGTGNDFSNSIQQTKDGGFIIAGSTNSFGAGGYDVYVIRTDSSGSTLWTKTFGGNDDDKGYSIQQTSDGGFIVAGETYSFGAGNNDVYLIRLDKETGVEEKSNIKYQKINIQIGRNPFRTSTIIHYATPPNSDSRLSAVGGNTKLTIYDISGRCIKTLVNEQKPAGTYTAILNAKELKAGIYFAELKTGNYNVTKKLILMK